MFRTRHNVCRGCLPIVEEVSGNGRAVPVMVFEGMWKRVGMEFCARWGKEEKGATREYGRQAEFVAFLKGCYDAISTPLDFTIAFPVVCLSVLRERYAGRQTSGICFICLLDFWREEKQGFLVSNPTKASPTSAVAWCDVLFVCLVLRSIAMRGSRVS